MSRLQLLMVLYGLFDIAMGLIGTLMTKTHELASLAGGGGAGILVVGCAALSKTNPRFGFIGATLIAILVAGKFASSTFQGQIYPAAIIFGVSILFAGCLVGAHFMAVNKRKQAGNPSK